MNLGASNKVVMAHRQRLKGFLYQLVSALSRTPYKIRQIILSLNNAEAMTKNTHFQPKSEAVNEHFPGVTPWHETRPLSF
jgi:hypothetical protein